MPLSRRVAVAFAISISLHVAFFATLAMKPERAPEPEEEAPLEIVIHPNTAPEAPEPGEAALSAAAPAYALPSLGADAERTELDPARLKVADQAPENAEFLASHHSLAARMRGSVGKSLPAPTPIPLEAPSLPRPTPIPRGAPEEASGLSISLAPAPGETGEGGEDDEAGVAAIGAWKKAVANAIGARWNLYRESKLNLLAVGSVRIKFVVDAEGRVSGVRVAANTAGPNNALWAVRAITEAKIPPIPPERLARTPGGRVEVEYSFTIFPTQ